MSTLETKVIGVLARTADARTQAQIGEHLPGVDRGDLTVAVSRLVVDGAIERIRGPGSLETYRLMYVPEKDWNGMHVRVSFGFLLLSIIGAGFILLGLVAIWSMP